VSPRKDRFLAADLSAVREFIGALCGERLLIAEFAGKGRRERREDAWVLASLFDDAI